MFEGAAGKLTINSAYFLCADGSTFERAASAGRDRRDSARGTLLPPHLRGLHPPRPRGERRPQVTFLFVSVSVSYLLAVDSYLLVDYWVEPGDSPLCACVCSVFSVFGTIKSIRLPQEPSRPGKHRGYAYIEYESEQQCTDAITAMNLFDLGGLPLRVTRVRLLALCTITAFTLFYFLLTA